MGINEAFKIKIDTEENYDEGLLESKKFELENLLVEYYDRSHFWFFLKGVFNQKTIPDLYRFLAFYFEREYQIDIYRTTNIKYFIRVIDDVLVQLKQFEMEGYLAFTFATTVYSLKTSMWHLLYIKDVLEEFLKSPEKIEYLPEEDDDVLYDTCTDVKENVIDTISHEENKSLLSNKKTDIISNKNRIAVLHYMLRDKIDSETIIKIANYVTNKEYDINNKANNSAYKYVHKPELFREKNENIEYIVQSLEKYGFKIPKELE